MIRISETDDCVIDYDKERNMFRVSIFENNHFLEEYWLDAYENKETSKDTPMPIERFVKPMFQHNAWWTGRCPRCNQILSYNFNGDLNNKKQYCWKCGQLVDFEEEE